MTDNKELSNWLNDMVQKAIEPSEKRETRNIAVYIEYTDGDVETGYYGADGVSSTWLATVTGLAAQDGAALHIQEVQDNDED